MKDPVRQEEIGEYRVSVYYDIDPLCPCTDWDLCGLFLWEYDRCGGLSRACNYHEFYDTNQGHTLKDCLRQLVETYVSWEKFIKYIKNKNVNNLSLTYSKEQNLWKLLSCPTSNRSGNDKYYTAFELTPSEMKDGGYFYEFLQYFDEDDIVSLLDKEAKDIAIACWQTRGYCQGDYCEGIAYCDKERFDKMCGRKDKPWREAAEECMLGEAETLGKWMWGDVYGFVLEKKVHYTKVYDDSERSDEDDFEWEEVDSCWGYFTSPDELVDEVIHEHNLKKTA